MVSRNNNLHNLLAENRPIPNPSLKGRALEGFHRQEMCKFITLKGIYIRPSLHAQRALWVGEGLGIGHSPQFKTLRSRL